MANATVESRIFRGSVENLGDSRSLGYTPDSSFIFDTAGKGAHPIDALLACLSACIAHHIVHWLNDRKIENPGFKVSASGKLTEDRQRIAGITVVSDIERVADTAAKRKDLLEYVRRCPVHNTLAAGCPIDFSWS